MKDRFNENAIRVLAGEASAEEERLFHKWLEEDEALQKEFASLKETWEESSAYITPSFAAEDWARLDRRISGEAEHVILTSIVTENTGGKIPMAGGKQAFLGTVWAKVGMVASFVLMAGLGWVIWANNFAWKRFDAAEANMEILLPDQSRVVLKKGSTLKYAPDFNENRDLELSGEAYFEVTKDSLHPFQVETGETYTTVLGTSFVIHEKREEKTVEIRVVGGKVSFGRNRDASLILTKGMAARYHTDTKELKNISFGSENEVTWAKNVLHFDNTDIETTLADIAHYYEIEITHALPKDYCPLTGDYGAANLEQIKEVLRDVLELDIAVKGNKWTIQGGTCHK